MCIVGAQYPGNTDVFSALAGWNDTAFLWRHVPMGLLAAYARVRKSLKRQPCSQTKRFLFLDAQCKLFDQRPQRNADTCSQHYVQRR